MKVRSVGIIGAGNVGSHVGFALASQGEADEILLCDIKKEKAAAEAQDLNDACSFLPHKIRARAVEATEMGDCDVVFIAAGPLPTVEQDRLDTLDVTLDCLEEVLPKLKVSGFKGFIISISNPADVIAAFVQRYMELPANRVISSGTSLDTARFQHMLSKVLGVHNLDMNAWVMGEHGSSSMIPWSAVAIAGKSLDILQSEQPDVYPSFDRAAMLEAVKDRGAVVQAGKSCTEFGVSTCAVRIWRAIVHDEKRVLPVACMLQGEYGKSGGYASVPTVLGKNGAERIIEIPMNEDERRAFDKAYDVILAYTERAWRRHIGK